MHNHAAIRILVLALTSGCVADWSRSDWAETGTATTDWDGSTDTSEPSDTSDGPAPDGCDERAVAIGTATDAHATAADGDPLVLTEGADGMVTGQLSVRITGLGTDPVVEATLETVPPTEPIGLRPPASVTLDPYDPTTCNGEQAGLPLWLEPPGPQPMVPWACDLDGAPVKLTVSASSGGRSVSGSVELVATLDPSVRCE